MLRKRTSLTLTGYVVLAVILLPFGGILGVKLAKAAEDKSQRERGRYLVTTVGCGDCHTPWSMGPNGPAPDTKRLLSGHPASITMPPPPKLPEGPWNWMGAASFTVFAGPWGISYAANLTPDKTGLGDWKEAQFVQALRTGKHKGNGRPILPPMPWPAFSQMTDADLKAMFAYLQSIPALANKVPDPVIAPPPK